jgi:putative tricarboxylic transport membrane protein
VGIEFSPHLRLTLRGEVSLQPKSYLREKPIIQRNMKIHERIGGFIWLLLGIGVCVGAAKMRMGNLHKPGPGFMPFLAGALLGLFGLILLLSTISRGGGEEKPTTSENEGRGKNWKMFFLCVLALFGYAFLIEPLGFYTTTGVFLFALFKLANHQKWVMPLISAGVTVVLSYLIFTVWLNTQFPGGVTGF